MSYYAQQTEQNFFFEIGSNIIHYGLAKQCNWDMARATRHKSRLTKVTLGFAAAVLAPQPLESCHSSADY